MLLDLIHHDTEAHSGLQIYLRNMMMVMIFDAERRGRLVTRPELDQYTYWLASAVTEALHYFIGHGSYSPQDEFRYQAVSGAHIAHMLRDALEDAEAGYYNLPREMVASHGVAPWDVKHKVYRDWVKESVKNARAYFSVGRAYLARVENLRCRIAGYAYIRRFEIVLDSIEREDCLLRADYPERKTFVCRIVMMFWALWMAFKPRKPASNSAVYLVR
jgi:phytoene/squalene synthetase